MSEKFEKLIVDSSALIQNLPLEDYADELYTIREIVTEIKDRATKVRLQTKPYKWNFLEPNAKSYLIVQEAAKKIGDLSNLSIVDLKLLALTVQIAEEQGLLIRSPENIVPTKVGPATKDDARDISDQLPGWGEFEEESDSDESDEWITPENIQNDRTMDETQQTKSACATCDFSMQNVLISLGLTVIARDGMLVKEVRAWALRCATCFGITHDMNKIFCPSCGQKNLKRVPYTTDKETGEKKYFLSKSRQPKCLNLRGTIYSTPAPKGGKHCTDQVVCEGQKIYFDRMSKKAMRRANILTQDLDDCDSPFALKDVSSRGFYRGNTGRKKASIPTTYTAQQLRMGVGLGNNKKKSKGKKNK